MRHSISKFAVVVGLAFLAMGITIPAQQVQEAPAGFDGMTNGSVAQNVMDDASSQFQEIEAPTPNAPGE